MVGCGEGSFVIVARPAPFDKGIGNHRLKCCGDGADPAQHRDIAGLDGNVGAVADKPCAALEHRDTRRLILAPGIDVVISWLQQLDGTL